MSPHSRGASPFACLISRTFSVSQVFFSHNKSANNIFRHDFSNQTMKSQMLLSFVNASHSHVQGTQILTNFNSMA